MSSHFSLILTELQNNYKINRIIKNVHLQVKYHKKPESWKHP